MPRYPKQEVVNPEAPQGAQEVPIVRRLSSDILELSPVAVRQVAPETIELAPDPELDAKIAEVLGLISDPPGTPEVNPDNRPEVVQPAMRPLAVEDKPLHLMTREELMERLNAINASTKLATPLNELPGPRPTMTERQMTQREAELARGAERVAANAAQKIAPRPPLTAVTPGRQDPLLKPPLPLQTPVIEPTMAQARAEPDTEYVPDMQHGYIETGKRSPAEYKGG
jgi:acetyl esterase/lipase